MLDLDDPMSEHIIRAAVLVDRVMVWGQEMSVSPSVVREELLAKCLPVFGEMRELGRVRFSERAAKILPAVDGYEAAVRALAGLGGGRIEEDRRDGEGGCPACGAAITKFCPLPRRKGYEGYWIIVCDRCAKPFMEARSELDRLFGTWAI
jgi:hypothetical protein